MSKKSKIDANVASSENQNNGHNSHDTKENLPNSSSHHHGDYQYSIIAPSPDAFKCEGIPPYVSAYPS
jgi:hypothetical protein